MYQQCQQLGARGRGHGLWQIYPSASVPVASGLPSRCLHTASPRRLRCPREGIVKADIEMHWFDVTICIRASDVSFQVQT